MTPTAASSDAAPPASCPWCGQQRIHGVYPSANGDRQYRCVACGTTFFLHAIPQWPTDRLVAPSSPSPYTPPRSSDPQSARKR
jgi:hypothetical protein